jgi:hypothetical protein
MIEPTEDEVDRAFHAIKECMANDAWKIPYRRREEGDRLVRVAARQALLWAKNPELAFKCGDSATQS